jgi:lysosomal acid phosphatase
MLGATLRSTYLEPSAPSHIKGISSKVVDPKQIHVRVKGGYAGEGPVIFDSAIAVLQGLYPPDPSNKITLANDTTVVSPLGGYQYVPGK